jgi:hypothetical protein
MHTPLLTHALHAHTPCTSRPTQGDDEDQADASERWVTVSVEGSHEACVKATPGVLEQCRAVALDGRVEIMGYPEFVATFNTRVGKKK